MPIPSQNEFLLPFLQLLSSGHPRTRSQIAADLKQHFSLTDADVQQMSGMQLTVVNRIAWCDIHFVKAGFVRKRQHPTESGQDTFTITALGVRELQRCADRIRVGYLMGFYRGKVYRGAGSDDTTSDAELTLYEAFEKLPDEFTVFHSVKWIAKSRGTVGEVDFLIAHPQRGVLVLEVKGGEITIEDGKWYSTSHTGRTVPINNPCEQAERNRRALHDWLMDDYRTKRLNYALFPAVALPDSYVARDVRPDCPREIFIDIRHLENLPARLNQIFDYWQSRADVKNQCMDGRVAIDALVDLLVPSRRLQPRIAEVFERERCKIDALTQQQFMILRLLKMQKRAAIVGGAGTGKTMLAMEKCQQLLDAGYRVLFLCFNQNLKQWLEQSLHHENVMVTTFHGIVSHALRWSGVPKPPGDFYNQSADILTDATQALQAQKSDKLFDAIVVDEAQDFEDTWWIPLPDLLKDPKEGVFYVFFDDNQRIYTQISNIPMSSEPVFLSDNCRNTQHIHSKLMPYMQDWYETVCLGPEGRPVEIISADTPQAARKALQSMLHRLVNEEGVRAEDVVVLTPASQRRSQWSQDDRLGNFSLSWDLRKDVEHGIRVATIFAYKGLESAIVILTELDLAREEIRDQLIYVGMSRARHHAVVIGALPVPQVNSSVNQ